MKRLLLLIVFMASGIFSQGCLAQRPKGDLIYCSYSKAGSAGLGKEYCELIADTDSVPKVVVVIGKGNRFGDPEINMSYPVDKESVDSLQALLDDDKVYKLAGYEVEEPMTGGYAYRIYMEYSSGEKINARWYGHKIKDSAISAYNMIHGFFTPWREKASLPPDLAWAQGIVHETLWYDGAVDYEAHVRNDGSIIMQACTEGQDLEFLMIPVEGKKYSYVIYDGYTDGAVNTFNEGYTATYKHQEGMTVICVYNLDGGLDNVLVKTPDDNRHNNVATWISRIKGTYTTDPYGYTVRVGDGKVTVDGTNGTFEVQTFNDMIIGVVKVQGTQADGLWQLIPTRKGFNVYMGKFDEYGHFNRTEGPFKLIPDRYTDLFDFASNQILNRDVLSDYTRSTLRIIRNSILAHHGYRFQSQDLQDYFGGQEWYFPGDNSKVKLSFIEQLNIEMIKSAEADADHDNYACEE